MEQERMLKRNRRKKAAIAIAAVIALALAGTFAWANYTQLALNEAVSSAQQGGRLHDDFTFKTAAASNKDVYVENFTSTDDGGVPIYARVRFLEYMEKGPNAGKDADNQATSVATTGVNNAVPTRTDKTSWTLHHYLPGTDADKHDDDAIHDYWDWEYGGSTIYMPTYNKNKDSYQADVNGSMQDVNASGSPDPYCNYKEYASAGIEDIEEREAAYDDDTNTVDEGYGQYDGKGGVRTAAGVQGNYTVHMERHTTAETLYGTVMSMEEWKALDENSKVGPFWVYDTDGWAYWAQPVDPGTATGLLLTNIAPKAIGDDWYYGIEAQAQFASYNEWGGSEGDYSFTTTASGDQVNGNSMSNDAHSLLELAKLKDSSAKPAATYSLSLTPTSATIDAGKNVEFTAATTKTEGESSATETEGYTWTVSPSDAGTLSGNETDAKRTLTIGSNAWGKTISVTVKGATSKLSTTATVTVSEKPATPPAAGDIPSTTPGSTTPVKLDINGDGTKDTDFYVLAKKDFTASELKDGGCKNVGTYGLVLAKDLASMDNLAFGPNNFWGGSTAENWCVSYYNRLAADLKALVPKVAITTQSGLGDQNATSTSNDTVFFLSQADVFGTYSASLSSDPQATNAALYTTGKVGSIVPSSIRAATLSDGTANHWWLRSLRRDSTRVTLVGTDGTLSESDCRSTGILARPAFWVYLGSDF